MAEKKQYLRSLPVKLNDAEIRERGRESGQCMVDKFAAEAELDAAKRKAKDLIEKLDDRAATLGRILLSGTEDRPVPIEFERDYQRSLVRTIRLDTMEVIDSRPMESHERQESLLDDGDEPIAPKKSKAKKADAHPEA